MSASSEDRHSAEVDETYVSAASLMRNADSGTEPAMSEPAPHYAEEPSLPASDQAQDESAEEGGLSMPQMLQLMRLEVDRAQRHQYPISCMVIGLDGFSLAEHEEYRKVLMPAIFQELKVVTFQNDVRGLGTWSPGFQFAVFPHVKPDQIASLATQLLDRVRALQVEDDERSYDITASIGVAHNLHAGEMSFEDFLEDAERGLRLAESRGGDRVEQFKGVESQVDSIKQELKQRAREVRSQQKNFFEEKATLEEKWGSDLIKKILAVFHAEPEISEGTIRLEKTVLEMVSAEVETLRGSSTLRMMAESQSQVEQLERRIAKLSESLDTTEKELRRVAAMKNVETGVASIYRTVQGLSDDDDNAEQKREMMQDIFDANLAFRKELKAKKK